MLLIYFILAIIISLGLLFQNSKTGITLLIILFLGLQVTLTAYIWINQGKTELRYFTFDTLATIFVSILAIISSTTVFHSYFYLKEEKIRSVKIYLSALTGLIASITAVYLANDVSVTWIFVEITTLTVATLIYHDRSQFSLEATWKYIFICSTGIAIAYMGILFLSITLHSGRVFDMSFITLGRAVISANPTYLKVAFLFVLVGYSTKMELFPMHTVGIDANSVAPPPIGGFISTVLVNVGFIAIFRIYIILSHTPIYEWMKSLLLLVGVLSIIVAAGYMLKAKHNKRILAYSTLENMGIVAIGLGIGGIGCYAALLLIILHSFTKASLFYQIGQMYQVLHTYFLDQSGRYLKLHPSGAMVMIIGLLCILAIPPSGIFISEFMIFKALINADKWLVLILSFLFLSIVVYAMVTRFLYIIYAEPNEYVSERTFGKANPWETITQFALLGFVMFICFYQPPFMVKLINNALIALPK